MAVNNRTKTQEFIILYRHPQTGWLSGVEFGMF